jgi:hypothetical protein
LPTTAAAGRTRTEGSEKPMYRPGGLTALAVINFIIAGFFGLGLLGLVIVLAGTGDRPKGVSESYLYMRTLFLACDVTLLVVAGVGYLRQRRVMGRWLGSAEAVFSLLFFGYVLGYTLGQGHPFMFSALQQLIYPGITLVLLNVVFRENLVN